MMSPRHSNGRRSPHFGFAVFILAFGLLAPGCSLFKRSPKAQNMEPEVPTIAGVPEPAPSAGSPLQTSLTPHVSGGLETATPVKPSRALHPDVIRAQNAYDKAFKAYEKSDYGQAAERFQGFITDYPAMPGFEKAQFYLGASLYHLGRYEESLQPLRRAQARARTAEDQSDSMLMLGQALLFQKKYDEALVTTFELAPDATLQQRLGLAASQAAAESPKITRVIPLRDKVRAYLLRAQIFAAMNRQDDASETLRNGKRLLEDSTDYGINRTTAQKLGGEFAWRELEILKIKCLRVPVPAKMSEDEFLNYAKSYYACADRAMGLYCEVAGSGNTDALKLARVPYKDLALYPLALKDHLPPPARLLKSKTAIPHYQAEMKDLIDHTVQAKAKSYRDLEDCGQKVAF